jgi:hypothetical protein
MYLSQEKKFELIKHVTIIMEGLNEKNPDKIKKEITALKKKSINLSKDIQKDIQDFIIQADIQKDYDIAHGTSLKLKQMADKLIKDLRVT